MTFGVFFALFLVKSSNCHKGSLMIMEQTLLATENIQQLKAIIFSPKIFSENVFLELKKTNTNLV